MSDSRRSDSATSKIELHIGQDVERFASAKDFVEFATAEGLQRFSRLHLTVEGARGVVNVEWSTPRAEEGPSLFDMAWTERIPAGVRYGLWFFVAFAMLCNAVLVAWRAPVARVGVRVIARTPSGSDSPELLDTVARAIERRTGSRDRHSGLAVNLDVVEREIGRLYEGVRDWPRIIVLVLTSVAVTAAIVGYFLWAFQPLFRTLSAESIVVDAELGITGPKEPAVLGGPWVWYTIAVGIVGIVLASAGRWIAPRIEISPVSRWQRVVAFAYRGVLAAVVAAVVSNGVRLLLGGK